MEQLRNLKQIYSLTAGRFNQYAGEDFVLPQIFKNQVKEINTNAITYNKYSAIIETRGNQNGVLNIYMPNQWFYIASFFTDFYNELLKYKRYALQAISRERLKDLNGASLTDAELNAIKQLDIDEQSQEYLKRFITDYSWWSGAKTIDRGDFYVSPILNSARLVNASQSFVADLCAFLADKEELVKAIISGEDTPTTIIKKELLRQKAAATFMKKAMRITIDRDSNFSRLAALNKYRKTSVQLQINGFNLGRDKNQLPNRIDDVDLDLEWEYDSQMFVLYLEWTPEMMENQFFPVYNEGYHGLLKMEKDFNGDYVLYEEAVAYTKKNKNCESLQQIFYGAPGTGKSDTIFERTKDLPKEDVFRTTFHPDSDYASFVGSYKPKMNDRTVYGAQGPLRNSRGEEISEPKITYTFSPQAFTNAYIRAWQTDGPVFLIIEEINRGNCAQIFGDLFQLLDRDENGYSKYDIVPDSDLSDYIKGKLEDAAEKEGLTSHIKEGKILKLPNNLYIWATMNTSDQSLFPIDSAFKRRWEWKYIKIKKGIDKNTGAELDWKIKVSDESYDWWEFLKAINYKIDKMTSSADKQLGYFFCLADGKGEISADTFVNKVAFYLWNDVFKDYAEDGSPLLKYKKNEEDKSESDLTFPDFFDQSGEIDKNVVKQFIEKVMKEDDMDKSAE